ncbi:MAG TPA: hypothetical protein VEZ15_13080 [Acidimicrobiia bacterium]|nr:hypothetical protein [Acidimicrobiia bacterium]
MRFLIGIACAIAALVPLSLGSRRLRRRYLPELTGPAGILAGVIIGLAIVVVVSEILGTVGLFRLVFVAIALAAAGLIAWRGIPSESRRPMPLRDAGVRQEPHDLGGSWSRFAAIGAVAIVGAEWSMRTADSLQRGMVTTADTLWYHLPFAARFVQTGWTSRLHFVDGGSYTAFFPASSELIHALGMMFLGNDTLSPLLNIGWLALALLAAWCIGRPYGVASLSLTGAAVVLAAPELALDDGGSALNDIVGIALFLAAIAILVNCRRTDDREALRPAALSCVAMAAGLALGTKFTLIPPVVALTVGVIALCPRGERLRRTALWLGVVSLTGGYWYLRNLIRVGNPLPSLGLGVGPLRLPEVPSPETSAVAKYLLDARVWRVQFLPGLGQAFGPAWWAVFMAAAAGWLLATVLAHGRRERMIALVGIACFVAYLLSPQILGDPRSPLFQFTVNVRYVALALAIGAVLLPIAATRLGRRGVIVVAVVFVCILVATQFAGNLWANHKTQIAGSTRGSSPRVWGALIGVGAFVVASTAHVMRSRIARWRATSTHVRLVACIAIGAVLAGSYGIERVYMRHRYAGPPLLAIDQWARHVHDARIGIVGFFLQYPLYGADLSNYVQYIAKRDADGTSSRITDCIAWRSAIDEGRYDYVVATTPGYPFATKQPALEATWTRSDPAATQLLQVSAGGGKAWLFRINGQLDAAHCRGS